MIKRAISVAITTALFTGCVSVAKHKKEIAQVRETDKSNCMASLETARSEAIIRGRQDMRQVMYQLIGKASAEEYIRFYSEVRKNLGIETTNEDYNNISKAALSKLVPIKKTGGSKQNGKDKK